MVPIRAREKATPVRKSLTIFIVLSAFDVEPSEWAICDGGLWDVT
jgi:hypothetical protein